ncbi:MAG: CBS domain-containing protein [Pseudomonadota bacterium]|nr:CBS domain-containing protein [Hyphomicrobiales bacterium]
MNVADILRTKSARVATVRMNETVAVAAKLLRAENTSALVVKDVCRTEGNVVVGMFTERDVVRAMAEHGPKGADLKISSLISVQKLISCSQSDTVEQVSQVMTDNHIRHLPVLEDGRLVGIISIRDLVVAHENAASVQPAIA